MRLLAPNETVICQIKGVTHQTFVRTGVSADGNCFFHCVLRATDSDYKRLDYTQQLERVQQLRKKIVNAITPELFAELGNSQTRRLFFFQMLNQLLEKGFPKDSVGELLEQKISLSKILERSSSGSEGFYITFMKILQEEFVSHFGSTAWEKCFQYIEKFICDSFEQAHKNALEHFRNSIESMGSFIGSTEIECISRILEKNFLFMQPDSLDENVLIPYPSVYSIINVSWPFFVIVWFKDHFEILGRVREGREPKTWERSFKYHDRFVRWILDEDKTNHL
jgi:hypothetical protein